MSEFEYTVAALRLEADFDLPESDHKVQLRIDEAIDYLDAYTFWRKRLARGRLSATTVRRIVRELIGRVERGKDGLLRESEDGYSYELRPTMGGGDWWLSSRDLALLGDRSKSRRRMRTFDVVRDPGWGPYGSA